jgi:site-specific DNA-methyltransferase (adenine-specific)
MAPHPSIKPQKLMRYIVRGVLPLGEGVIYDPFSGSGSTLAAAASLGYQAIGTERDPEYFQMAVAAIPRLSGLHG